MKKLMMLTLAGLVISAGAAHAEAYSKYKEADSNGDGAISKTEFLAAQEKRFDTLDLNGDGSITKDEAKENRETRRENIKERMENRKERRQERLDSTSE